jgi:hypothetical protein
MNSADTAILVTVISEGIGLAILILTYGIRQGRMLQRLDDSITVNRREHEAFAKRDSDLAKEHKVLQRAEQEMERRLTEAEAVCRITHKRGKD